MTGKEQRQYRTIGILGGMGPQATADFLAKIVALTEAERDQDHLPVIVYNMPQIPDRSAAVLTGSDAPFPALLTQLASLERAGAEIVAIPCNTAHHWHEKLSALSRCRLLHIVDAVKYKLQIANCRRIGLLATRGTVVSQLYQRRLAGTVECVLTPDVYGQNHVDNAIQSVKAGKGSTDAMDAVVRQLLENGADKIILGCTELPILFERSEARTHCIDATSALAESCIVAAGGVVRQTA